MVHFGFLFAIFNKFEFIFIAPSLNYEDQHIQNISWDQLEKLSPKEIENNVWRTSTNSEIENPNIDIMKINHTKKRTHELLSLNKEQIWNYDGIDIIKEKIDKKVIEDSYNIDLYLTIPQHLVSEVSQVCFVAFKICQGVYKDSFLINMYDWRLVGLLFLRRVLLNPHNYSLLVCVTQPL